MIVRLVDSKDEWDIFEWTNHHTARDMSLSSETIEY